ncbi:FAD-dependent thymidylate synthase [Micromonospora sp. NPDC005652]|uniref:FAD-dependent thymidylate synthase n=1 Tax=Micromonospora sp. NPDC005652 TaxID=3157046 RepID=UPI0033E42158
MVAPQVKLIAWTQFQAPEEVPWSTDADGGQALAEFAGRACYQSWKKPNPATATNAGYLAHILEVGHLSVLEHGSVSFYFSGVSRSFTHELIRHRHFSYSQLSQRYVPGRDAAMVEPSVIADDPELHKKFIEATDAAVRAYTELVDALESRAVQAQCVRCSTPLVRESDPMSWRCPFCKHRFSDADTVRIPPLTTAQKKEARQAARAVLPNATETRIVVTGNYRAWRHFVKMRATEHADVEIRELAVECLRQLKGVAPNVFADFEISTLPDGTEVASTRYAE